MRFKQMDACGIIGLGHRLVLLFPVQSNIVIVTSQRIYRRLTVCYITCHHVA
ncbi:hypothetical protein HMPREF9441_02506 [Paraprevotella clara YIT 11840]|uniref:Uncharacterized protein n=1 Tax=Paraprevotella clara YIT 11840 TaxID=762968 RepID=G5ST06_9BACT|nr:hypothetical protein HMPREF9441_02506 [Paraprevotella clara YIT 11840]